MSDQIEITVTEVDPDTGARVTRRVKIEKTGADEARLTDAEGKERTLDRVRKREPDNPTEDDPVRVTGRLDVPFPANDRTITFVVRCDRTPPVVELVVTYAEGKDRGQRDEARCKSYQLTPEECRRLRRFIHELDVPSLVALGPGVDLGPFAEAWLTPAVGALAENLDAAASAVRAGRPSWYPTDDGAIELVPVTPGATITCVRDGDELCVVVRVRPGAAVPAPPAARLDAEQARPPRPRATRTR